MKEEIKAACEWWAASLRNKPEHDNGDEQQSAFGRLSARTLKPVTEEQLQLFKEHLATALEEKFQKFWHPEEPNLESYFRCISVDYGPCLVLHNAATAAGITALGLRFPWKTNMWINPGKVTVGAGYRATAEVIWEKPHVVFCQGKCNSPADDHCGMHMSNEKCPACEAAEHNERVESDGRHDAAGGENV